MNTRLKEMALKAISNETPLKGYELGVLDAGVREGTGELIVILLDGRKMVFPPPTVDMKARTPAPNMKPTAGTAKKGDASGSKTKKESKS